MYKDSHCQSDIFIKTSYLEERQTMTELELQREKDLQRIADFRLFDDDFLSEVFDNNTKVAALILNIILERSDMKVIKAETQSEYKSATMRSIKLDVRAEDTARKVYDIEIQRSDHGNGAKRARVHSSMIDRTLLQKGQDFDSIVDTYVIFITENDKYDAGLPMYHIDRTIKELSHVSFEDGAHIIYVNGEYRDTAHPIGKLMHDFNCKNASDMLLSELAESVRYYKETEGGRSHMCRAMEDMRDETARKKAIEIALKMLSGGKLNMEEIAEYSGLTIDEVKELANKQSA